MESLREFGYDASYLVDRYCWSPIEQGAPGKGICSAYTVGNDPEKMVYVCILPTIGYPRNPPFLLLVEPRGSKAFKYISHPCVIRVNLSALGGLLPRELVGWVREHADHIKVVHVLDEGMWRSMRNATNRLVLNRLVLIVNLLRDRLGLVPYSGSC